MRLGLLLVHADTEASGKSRAADIAIFVYLAMMKFVMKDLSMIMIDSESPVLL